MAQQEILEALQRNPDKWLTTKQVSKLSKVPLKNTRNSLYKVYHWHKRTGKLLRRIINKNNLCGYEYLWKS